MKPRDYVCAAFPLGVASIPATESDRGYAARIGARYRNGRLFVVAAFARRLTRRRTRIVVYTFRQYRRNNILYRWPALSASLQPLQTRKGRRRVVREDRNDTRGVAGKYLHFR